VRTKKPALSCERAGRVSESGSGRWFEDAYVVEPPSTSREAQGMHAHMHMQEEAEARRLVIVEPR
jgi:trehalose-6-phosphate synthase